MRDVTMTKIAQAVKHAREKHPKFARSFAEAHCLASEELGEVARAITDSEGRERICEEALDTIAVLVRLIEGEVR